MFWLLLFGSTALILLAVIEPKFARRQERLERMSHSRSRATQAVAASDKVPSDSTYAEAPRWEAQRRPTLQPLILFIAFVLLAGSLAMRFQIGRRAGPADRAAGSKETTHGKAEL